MNDGLPKGVIPAPVDLSEVDGNAMVIIGTVARALRRAGNHPNVVNRYRTESLRGDYDHVLQTALRYTVDPDD
jgi:hypothetical protein